MRKLLAIFFIFLFTFNAYAQEGVVDEIATKEWAQIHPDRLLGRNVLEVPKMDALNALKIRMTQLNNDLSDMRGSVIDNVVSMGRIYNFLMGGRMISNLDKASSDDGTIFVRTKQTALEIYNTYLRVSTFLTRYYDETYSLEFPIPENVSTTEDYDKFAEEVYIKFLEQVSEASSTVAEFDMDNPDTTNLNASLIQYRATYRQLQNILDTAELFMLLTTPPENQGEFWLPVGDYLPSVYMERLQELKTHYDIFAEYISQLTPEEKEKFMDEESFDMLFPSKENPSKQFLSMLAATSVYEPLVDSTGNGAYMNLIGNEYADSFDLYGTNIKPLVLVGSNNPYITVYNKTSFVTRDATVRDIYEGINNNKMQLFVLRKDRLRYNSDTDMFEYIDAEGNLTEGNDDSVISSSVVGSINDRDNVSAPVFSTGLFDRELAITLSEGDDTAKRKIELELQRFNFNHMVMYNVFKRAASLSPRLLGEPVFMDSIGNIVTQDNIVIVPAMSNALFFYKESLMPIFTKAFVNHYPNFKYDGTPDRFRDTTKFIYANRNATQADRDYSANFLIFKGTDGSVTYSTNADKLMLLMTSDGKILSVDKVANHADNSALKTKKSKSSDLLKYDIAPISLMNYGVGITEDIGTYVFDGFMREIDSTKIGETKYSNFIAVLYKGMTTVDSEGIMAAINEVFNQPESEKLLYDINMAALSADVMGESTSVLLDGTFFYDNIYHTILTTSSNLSLYIRDFKSRNDSIVDELASNVTETLGGTLHPAYAGISGMTGTVGVQSAWTNIALKWMEGYGMVVSAIVMIVVMIMVIMKMVQGKGTLLTHAALAIFVALLLFFGFRYAPKYISAVANTLINDTGEEILYTTLLLRHENSYAQFNKQLQSLGDTRVTRSQPSLTLFKMQDVELEDFLGSFSTYGGIDRLTYIQEEGALLPDSNLFALGDEIRIDLDHVLSNVSITSGEAANGELGKYHKYSMEKRMSSGYEYYSPHYVLMSNYINSMNTFSTIAKPARRSILYDEQIQKPGYIVESYYNSAMFYFPDDLEKLQTFLRLTAIESLEEGALPTPDPLVSPSPDPTAAPSPTPNPEVDMMVDQVMRILLQEYAPQTLNELDAGDEDVDWPRFLLWSVSDVFQVRRTLLNAYVEFMGGYYTDLDNGITAGGMASRLDIDMQARLEKLLGDNNADGLSAATAEAMKWSDVYDEDGNVLDEDLKLYYKNIADSLWFKTLFLNGFLDWVNIDADAKGSVGLTREDSLKKFEGLIATVNGNTARLALTLQDEMVYCSDETLIKILSLYASILFNQDVSRPFACVYPQNINIDELNIDDMYRTVLTDNSTDRYSRSSVDLLYYVAVKADFGGILLIFLNSLLEAFNNIVMNILIGILVYLIIFIIVYKIMSDDSSTNAYKGLAKMCIIVAMCIIGYQVKFHIVFAMGNILMLKLVIMLCFNIVIAYALVMLVKRIALDLPNMGYSVGGKDLLSKSMDKITGSVRTRKEKEREDYIREYRPEYEDRYSRERDMRGYEAIESRADTYYKASEGRGSRLTIGSMSENDVRDGLRRIGVRNYNLRRMTSGAIEVDFDSRDDLLLAREEFER